MLTNARCWFPTSSGATRVESGVDAICALYARGRLGKINNVSGQGSRNRRDRHTWWGHRRQEDNNPFLAGGTCKVRDKKINKLP